MSAGRAPGKIILFGEHAVVYRRPAIAVPVLGVEVNAQIEILEAETTGQVWLESATVAVSGWIHDLKPGHPLATTLQLGLQALNITGFPSFRLRIRSSIPVASGLGSSAAVSVAIFRALNDHFKGDLTTQDINQMAYRIEKEYHGTPSGVDNTVIAYEQPVFFTMDADPEILRLSRPMHFVVADSGITSSTSEAVQGVRQRWEQEPSRYEALFDAIGQISREARGIMVGETRGSLGELMDRNHSLLQEIGVSSAVLDTLVNRARDAGARGAKLSGAGLGGNIIALTHGGEDQSIADALLQAGASRILHTVVYP